MADPHTNIELIKIPTMKSQQWGSTYKKERRRKKKSRKVLNKRLNVFNWIQKWPKNMQELESVGCPCNK